MLPQCVLAFLLLATAFYAPPRRSAPSSQIAPVQRDAKSRGHLAEFHDGSAEAPHTEAYLLPQIVTRCAELGVRRVIDIGCCNGALCRELASRGYEVVGCVPARTVFGSHKIRHQSRCSIGSSRLRPVCGWVRQFCCGYCFGGGQASQSTWLREAAASARRPSYHQHSVSWLPEESFYCAK